jgi:microcystin-dependent protein
MFGGNFAPAGWAFCDGQSIPISENDILFTLIGTTYGGDGQSTFNLPNLQSRIPIHAGTGADGITYSLAEAAGVETVTLTVQQIPSHTHTMIATSGTGPENTPSNNILAQSAGVKMYSAAAPNTPLAAATVLPQGGSQPHENMQPYLVINFIISLFGVFPTQT